MTILDTVESAGYVANEAQVEQLASFVQTGRRADGAYLRILIVACQSALGRARRGRIPEQEPVLETVHNRFYPAVMRGVGAGDDTAEANRRATFARSAKSTIRYFIANGGDLRPLNASEVTKQGLRNMVRPVSAAFGSRDERIIQRSAEMLLRAVRRLSGKDADAARARLDELLDTLQETLDHLATDTAAETKAATAAAEQQGQTTTIVGRRGAPRGAPAGAMVHKGA